MKSFWLFRTNLRNLEYYHDYTCLDEFKRKCHDFYLLQGVWFLENNIFDEVVIWRLAPKGVEYKKEIVFEINGKQFIQRFVDSFEGCFNYSPTPEVTFFRGGFSGYGKLTKTNPDFFGMKLYCGTGKRVFPKYGGIYDKILVEDDRDIKNGAIPFYKTANQKIFKPLIVDQKYDICWPCNFSQVNYKGQEFFIKAVSQSSFLKGLKIIHVGNKLKVGRNLCNQYGVNNIKFAGYAPRYKLNELLNQSKLGLVTSNQKDGSPRVITEIMSSGTPLLLRDDTRALHYYSHETFRFSSSEEFKITIENLIIMWLCGRVQEDARLGIERLSIPTICKRNLALWGLI